ncbi:MAG: MBL fold metallo-hydrolase [Pseudomonadota bacterium]
MNSYIRTLTAAAALSLSSALATAADLTVEVFNPGEDALFPVTSSLISGPNEAILVDAQFDKANAQKVLKMVQDSGKNLKTIYISHGDPDFYFGLDVLTEAYPEAEVVASPSTIAHINATKDKKIGYWGPILAENAPSKVIVPAEISSNGFTVDGEKVEIVGLDGHDPKHTFLWIPTEKTVLGGVVLYENLHVWVADAQTQKDRDNWYKTLGVIRSLGAERIVPGHYLGETQEDLTAVNFTEEYVKAFEAASAKVEGSEALVKEMTTAYPDFPNVTDLGLSAKVLEGEMKWP